MRRSSRNRSGSDDLTHLNSPLNEVPMNEIRRLMIIKETGLSSSTDFQKYDRLLNVAYRAFSVSAAWLSIVDFNHVNFKSKIGLGQSQCGRLNSTCHHVVMDESPEIIVISDLTQDSRFKSHALVQEEPKLRFLAASPITIGNVKVGSITVADSLPRFRFGKRERLILVELAEIISNMLTEERNKLMDTEKDLAYVTSSVLNIIKHPLKKALSLLPKCRFHYERFSRLYQSDVLSRQRAREDLVTGFQSVVLDLQQEIQTLQELLQISLKSIMRIFRIGNYLQQNIHHHHHYFQTTASFTPKQQQQETAAKAKSPRSFTARERVLSGESTFRLSSAAVTPSSSSFTGPGTGYRRRRHYYNTNMILWNSDDNLHKLHGIAHKYQAHCLLTCLQHEPYLLNQDQLRLFTHSDIVLLLLILILNYAKATSHRCEIRIQPIVSGGAAEREAQVQTRQGFLEIDIRLIALLSHRSTLILAADSSSSSALPLPLSLPISQKGLRSESLDEEDCTIGTEQEEEDVSVARAASRGIEEADLNILLTALNLVHWVSGEVKVDSIELPSDRSSLQSITHCLIKIPALEKTLLADQEQEEKAKEELVLDLPPQLLFKKKEEKSLGIARQLWSWLQRRVFGWHHYNNNSNNNNNYYRQKKGEEEEESPNFDQSLSLVAADDSLWSEDKEKEQQDSLVFFTTRRSSSIRRTKPQPSSSSYLVKESRVLPN